MPGALRPASDAPFVDRIIETTPNGADFLPGLVAAWKPDELEHELRFERLRPPRRRRGRVPARWATGLWNTPRRPMASAPLVGLTG